MDYKYLEDVYYAPSHEWIRVEGDIATIGITDFAQNQLSDVVFVEFPMVGEVFDKEAEIGVIESAKAAGDLVIPISGEITELNEKLSDNPELINESPYDEGWIIKIIISNPAELDDLLSPADYKELVKKELESQK